ncbi:MAG: hypothetical protein ACD_28C00330G0003 [uncultured bacterium]|nr:MAG: hypothetical protein ACD_28C00330G0003 [uncultured bacterium]KKT76044.1 MAG: hypothetical protein UW70_C0023G0022 [Candidatus Peregrinibacteria bacterium GW2011_GWA2_44_7]
MKEVFVASTSKHKLGAVEGVAREVFPEEESKVEGRKASSGINEQPVGHEETIQGALHRLEELKGALDATRSRYDLLVAFESGIFPVTVGKVERWFDLAWVVIEDGNGTQKLAHSTGIEFDAADVEKAKAKGFKTTTAGSMISERTGADSTDPHSYLTHEVVSRSEMLRQALKTALGQLSRSILEQ